MHVGAATAGAAEALRVAKLLPRGAALACRRGDRSTAAAHKAKPLFSWRSCRTGTPAPGRACCQSCLSSSTYARGVQGGRADAISIRKKLLCWLYWVATGNKALDIEHASGVPSSNLCKQGVRGQGILWDVTDAVHDLLFSGINHDHGREICFPTTGRAQRAAMLKFEHLCGLPGCIGVVDGTLIRTPGLQRKQLKKDVNGLPIEEMKHWYCYKKFYAWLCRAVVDAHGRFIYVENDHPGAMGDAAAWNRSPLVREFLEPGLANRCTFEVDVASETKTLGSYVLSDSAFGLQEYCMKGYQVAQPGSQREAFNYMVCRTRRIVECAFGRLKSKFKFCI